MIRIGEKRAASAYNIGIIGDNNNFVNPFLKIFLESS